MGKQTVIEIISNLVWGVGISSLSFVINPILKNLNVFFKTYLKYSFKDKQLKSWEKIEKRKLKVIRHKKNPPG